MKAKNLRRADFDYFVTIPARWGDVDGLRHINHAAYLTYMESARVNFYQHLGFNMERWDLDVSTILASMQVDFIHQSNYPNNYEVAQRVVRTGKKSFDLLTAIFEDQRNEPIVVATFTLVTFNYTRQTTVPVPDNIRREVRPL